MVISYYFLILLVLILGVGAQFLVKTAYKKWKKNPSSFGVSGADAARTMLNSNGLGHVAIIEISGQLTDNFDPRTNVVSLSSEVYHGRTVSAVAIACHESGHALQYACEYVPAKARASIVPVASIASNLWVFVLIAGIFLSMIGLVYVAIALFGAVLLFQLITLPVEFDASKRAKSFIRQSGWLTQKEIGGASAVLRSASLTYVAAALASVLQFVYILGMRR
ncbi:MAG: zinc metallopeptidase [Coriobacteriales bacterium]|jgi:Zn-dependent membrane protease YugP|nr:zinc metallopeptidase [Coriobacteriales bacterium]